MSTSISDPKVTATFQVEFNGERITAHYESQLGEWVFMETTANVPYVSVLLVTQLVLLMKAFEQSR